MGICAYSPLKSTIPPSPGRPEYDFDAYTFYADEDSETVAKFVEFLETPRFKLRLYFRGRDPLDEFNTNIEPIKKRCRRMMVFLTPSFLQSPALEFLSSFMATISTDQAERVVLPLVLSPCDTPLILSGISTFDFTIEDNPGKMWERLIISLIPENKTGALLISLSKNPLRNEHFPVIVMGRISEIPVFQVDSSNDEQASPVTFKQ